MMVVFATHAECADVMQDFFTAVNQGDDLTPYFATGFSVFSYTDRSGDNFTMYYDENAVIEYLSTRQGEDWQLYSLQVNSMRPLGYRNIEFILTMGSSRWASGKGVMHCEDRTINIWSVVEVAWQLSPLEATPAPHPD
jgi:hypothetical protein